MFCVIYSPVSSIYLGGISLLVTHLALLKNASRLNAHVMLLEQRDSCLIWCMSEGRMDGCKDGWASVQKHNFICVFTDFGTVKV